MIRHDLHCTFCDYTEHDALVAEAGDYGECPVCGHALTWTPFVFATDVAGCEQEDVTGVLTDPAGRNLTWTSARERDRKMFEAYGVRPRGDKVHGARTEYDPLGKTSFHFGAVPHRSVKRKKRHGRSNPAA